MLWNLEVESTQICRTASKWDRVGCYGQIKLETVTSQVYREVTIERSTIPRVFITHYGSWVVGLKCACLFILLVTVSNFEIAVLGNEMAFTPSIKPTIERSLINHKSQIVTIKIHSIYPFIHRTKLPKGQLTGRVFELGSCEIERGNDLRCCEQTIRGWFEFRLEIPEDGSAETLVVLFTGHGFRNWFCQNISNYSSFSPVILRFRILSWFSLIELHVQDTTSKSEPMTSKVNREVTWLGWIESRSAMDQRCLLYWSWLDLVILETSLKPQIRNHGLFLPSFVPYLSGCWWLWFCDLEPNIHPSAMDDGMSREQVRTQCMLFPLNGLDWSCFWTWRL